MLDRQPKKPDERSLSSDERKTRADHLRFQHLCHFFCLNHIAVHVNFRNGFCVF
jgi:hypothetical protein